MLPHAHPRIPPTSVIICYMNLNALLFYEPKYYQCLSPLWCDFFSWHYYLPEALPRVSWLLVFQAAFMLSVLSSEILFMATTLRILLPSMQREMSGSCILETWNQFTLASWLYFLPFLFVCTLNFCIIFLLNLISQLSCIRRKQTKLSIHHPNFLNIFIVFN